MKILHICLQSSYIDGWGYQENLLPYYLTKKGSVNYVLTSSNNYPHYLKNDVIRDIESKGNSYSYNSVNIRRVPTKRISSSLSFCPNLYKHLSDIKPDAIFHHGVAFSTLPIVALYAKKHHIPLFVDNHADEINMSKNKVWIVINYRILGALACKVCNGVVTKYYGLSKSRCDFLSKYFKVPKSKIGFLPIGADVDLSSNIGDKPVLRKKYGFSADDFIVISGGKMGVDKGTDKLIEAVGGFKETHSQVKLILFGKIEDDFTEIQVQKNSLINVYGWCDRQKTLELLKLSDVACWPVHHTTLIEDAVSVCTPLILRKTDTTSHLISNNGVWIEKSSVMELQNALDSIIAKQQKGSLSVSCNVKKDELSYCAIAQQVLNDIYVFQKNSSSE